MVNCAKKRIIGYSLRKFLDKNSRIGFFTINGEETYARIIIERK